MVSGARTPVGSFRCATFSYPLSSLLPLSLFRSSLAALSANELGTVAIKAAVERAKIAPDAVQEVYMGNVCQANQGQAPTRQAVLRAGLSQATPCTTVNKVRVVV